MAGPSRVCVCNNKIYIQNEVGKNIYRYGTGDGGTARVQNKFLMNQIYHNDMSPHVVNISVKHCSGSGFAPDP